jgi:transposase
MGFHHSHRKTTTLVARLRTIGLVAPTVLYGPINGDWYEAYVRQVQVPDLKPGDIVIMDNLPSRNCTAARELIEQAGATLRFLPRPTTPTSTRSRRPLLQVQGHAAKGIGTSRLRAVGPHRQARRYLPGPRTRQLFPLMRILSGMIGKRSRPSNVRSCAVIGLSGFRDMRRVKDGQMLVGSIVLSA